MSAIRVLVADDHAVVRAGVRAMLESQEDLDMVGEAGDGPEAIEAAERLDPDVVVVDIVMPGMSGVEATRKILEVAPGTRDLMLSMHEDQAFVAASLAAGASGFVAKKAIASELLSAIRVVHGGRMYVNAELAAAGGQGSAAEALSAREREVMELLAYGYTNSEIAKQLELSDKTIATYRARLADKLGFKTRADIVRYALEAGLLAPGKLPNS